MSRVNRYASIEKRTFHSALVHLLETGYGLLGGRRVLQMLAEDVKVLVEEFYPAKERAEGGSLIWTCTAATGRKAQPGKRTEEVQSVTVVLPLVTPEDVQERGPSNTPAKQSGAVARARDKKRLVRLVKAAEEQGGLLTLAELGMIRNRGLEQTHQYVREWEEETGELLPLKGYRMDQGSRPTHKKEIVRLFEQGRQPPDIARETRHDIKSVERYLKDYERVKLLLKQGVRVEDISGLTGRGHHVVLEYVHIARQYHPELFSKPDPTS